VLWADATGVKQEKVHPDSWSENIAISPRLWMQLVRPARRPFAGIATALPHTVAAPPSNLIAAVQYLPVSGCNWPRRVRLPLAGRAATLPHIAAPPRGSTAKARYLPGSRCNWPRPDGPHLPVELGAFPQMDGRRLVIQRPNERPHKLIIAVGQVFLPPVLPEPRKPENSGMLSTSAYSMRRSRSVTGSSHPGYS
jgi:hypothetical protein